MSTENKQWYNLNSGVNGSVNSICAFNDELYVAGNFTKAGSVDVASGFAKWNGNTWLSVANIVGTINSCVVYNDELYVAGNFTSIDFVPCTNVAKFNGTSWSAIGSTPKEIYKLKVIGSDLFALSYYNTNETVNSGIFILNSETWNTFDLSIPLGKNEPYNSTENFIRINDIEKYGVNYFSAISNIFALAVYSNKLIAGGRFDIQGISVLKQYDNNSWTTFGGGIPLELNGSSNASIVYSLNVYNNELYVAGLFNRIGSLDKNLGLSVNSIAKWNGQIWSNFNYNESVSNIKTIFNYESELNIKSGTYIGGSFSYISDAIAKNIAVFSDIVGIPKTIYDLVGNLDQQCANIIPCGFRISQPDRPSDACGPRDGIDGAQGPPGLPGVDGKDGINGCKIFFVATNKQSRSSWLWNNPVDPAQHMSLDGSNIESIWPNANGPASYDDECKNNCVDIPSPGGSGATQTFINNFPTTGEVDSRGEPILDLSELTSGCSIAIDLGEGIYKPTIFFPNPDWDGISTGPQIGPEGYYNLIDDVPFQYNPNTGEYDIPVNGGSLLNSPINNGPFLLPGYALYLGGGDGVDCDAVLDCQPCIIGPVEFTQVYNYQSTQNASYIFPLQTGCDITAANSNANWITNVQTNGNAITFQLTQNSNSLERQATITYTSSDTSNPTRTKTGVLTIIQRAKLNINNLIHAKILSRSFSGGTIPRWNYTLIEVQFDGDSWEEVGSSFEANNFFEREGVVFSGSGYGGVELQGTGNVDGFPLVGFDNFKYKPVPVNLIVLVTVIYDEEGNPISRWFSAPNPIVGSCEVTIV